MASEKRKPLAILGAGAMGQTLCVGLLETEVFEPGEIVCSDVDQKKLSQLKARKKVQVAKNNADAAASADTILIAVKPPVVDSVLADISPVLSKEQLVISIAAGVTLKNIESKLPDGVPVIRAMPNTPCLLGYGATALSFGSRAGSKHVEIAEKIFGAVGETIHVQENLMDAVTGLSGSGPAYVYLIIEALADAGVSVGLPREAAQMLAGQTVLGAAAMVIETEVHPAQLRDMVTTPAGTTIAGLNALERGKLRATIVDAVQAATNRARELSSGNKNS